MMQSPHVLRANDGEHSGYESSAESESTAVCPLCGMRTEDSTGIYTHLQIGHKKSELAGFLLDS